jgi:hypothetical protein
MTGRSSTTEQETSMGRHGNGKPADTGKGGSSGGGAHGGGANSDSKGR